ncbi:hypothetical protein ACIRL2_43180 [Embleya sp. NPDC127516]|uniref:hypothetical protein n=1 Tax=Embleya sp. NPDC127516 TaxID=3363990 RepID=UPI003809853B
MTGPAPDVRVGASTPVLAQDPTHATTVWLRLRRGRGRARRFGYAVYIVVLLLGSTYGVYVAGAIHEVRRQPLAAYADELAAVLPSGLVLAAITVLALAAWDGLWRGPVTPPRPDVDWLLTLSVRRGRVLLPWFALSAGVWIVAALLLGLVGALVIAAAGLGGVGAGLLAFAALGVGVATLAVTGAAVVERSRRVADRLRRLVPVLVLGIVLGIVQVVAAARGHRSRGVETAQLWSGPWGWAAQPVLAAAGGSVPLWPLALALLILSTSAAVWAVPRLVAGIPTAELRVRTRASTGVLAGLWALDLRAARLGATGAADTRRAGRAQRWAARLRAPRRAALLVVWRDAVALLAAPRRTGLMLLLLAFSTATATVAAHTEGTAATPLTVAAALMGYFAAAALLESARLDGDDTRRAAWLPRPFARVALEHAPVPILLLVVAGCLFALPVTVLAHPGALLVVPAAAPVLVAAGLVGAYRPPTPAWMLSHPAFAQVGPVMAVVWYGAGPIVGVTGLTVLLAPSSMSGAGTATVSARLAACWALAALMLWWTHARARARR